MELRDEMRLKREHIFAGKPVRSESFHVESCPACGWRLDPHLNPLRPGGCVRCCE